MISLLFKILVGFGVLACIFILFDVLIGHLLVQYYPFGGGFTAIITVIGGTALFAAIAVFFENLGI
jgi:hypothetical protein